MCYVLLLLKRTFSPRMHRTGGLDGFADSDARGIYAEEAKDKNHPHQNTYVHTRSQNYYNNNSINARIYSYFRSVHHSVVTVPSM